MQSTLLVCVRRILNTLNVLHVIPLYTRHDTYKVLQYFKRTFDVLIHSVSFELLNRATIGYMHILV